jgi:hypothetical protein
VYVLSYGANSHELASGGDDGVCYLWDMLRPVGPVRSGPPSDLRFREWARNARDPSAMWNLLAGDDSEAAFFALGFLAAQPDEAVAVLAEKLRGVTSFIDPNAADEGASPEDAERTRRLKRQLIEKDPAIESLIAARRAIGLLFELRTPAARKLLEDLAADAGSDLGQLATDAVAALKQSE